MRYAIATYYYGENIDDVIALGNSIKIFSMMKSICVTVGISRDEGERLERSYDIVKVSDTPLDYILGMDEWDRIMILDPHLVLETRLDAFITNIGGTPGLKVVVVKPDRLISKIMKFDRDIVKIRSFYIDNKYHWVTLNSRYDKTPSNTTRRVFLENKYLAYPKKGDLISYLKDVLGPVLGEEGVNAIDRESSMYVMAFIHKSVNPVLNYDTMEAYGDGFLKSAYMWLLSSTPGVIEADQVTKIADYYGGREVLSEIAERMGLVKYIQASVPIDTKIKSDIIEALIAAIGFSWDKVYGRGDEGVRKYVFHIYSYYTIDVQHYKDVYTSPIQKFNVHIQSLRLDRDLVSNKTEVGDDVVYKLLYSGVIIGVGIVPRGKSVPEAKKAAKIKAYEDALSKKSLEKFLRC